MVVTTPNPLLLPRLTQQDGLITDVKIGIVNKSDRPDEPTDTDDDGILDKDEDVNGDGKLENDDTDRDGTPNYKDADDDGDGILTKDEGRGDADRDGTPDYLDADQMPLGGQQQVYLPTIMR